MRTDKINYACGDCPAKAIFKSYNAAREAGWALGGDYKRCWCPIHAPAHRLGGANGKSTTTAKWHPDYEQLKINV